MIDRISYMHAHTDTHIYVYIYNVYKTPKLIKNMVGLYLLF